MLYHQYADIFLTVCVFCVYECVGHCMCVSAYTLSLEREIGLQQAVDKGDD